MTPDERNELWNTYHRFYNSRVKAYAPKINKALKHQVSQFIEAKKSGAADTQALDMVTSSDLFNTIQPLYHDAARIYGAKVLSYLNRQKGRAPIGFNEFIENAITNFFRTSLLNTIEGITTHTRDLIRNIMIDSYRLGESFDDITARLQDAGFTENRGRLIARTETSTAANFGASTSAESTGLKMNKVWIAAQDNRTRRMPRDAHDHLHMNGVTIPQNDLFKVNGKHGIELMMYPGDGKHGADAGNICNCRCTHGYLPIRENGKVVRV